MISVIHFRLLNNFDTLMGRGRAPINDVVSADDIHHFFDTKVAAVRASILVMLLHRRSLPSRWAVFCASFVRWPSSKLWPSSVHWRAVCVWSVAKLCSETVGTLSRATNSWLFDVIELAGEVAECLPSSPLDRGSSFKSTGWHSTCGGLSAAVDTVDHVTLLSRLEVSYGISGNVHNWFTSYLSGRRQYVRRGFTRSMPTAVLFGVQHGSVLGLILFLLYPADLLGLVESGDTWVTTIYLCRWHTNLSFLSS